MDCQKSLSHKPTKFSCCMPDYVNRIAMIYLNFSVANIKTIAEQIVGLVDSKHAQTR